MVDHVVLFKITDGTPADKIQAMAKALEALREEIPQLIEMHAGSNLSDRHKGYTVMLVSRFRNTADLQTYVAHPAHKRVIAEFINPIREEVIVGDIEY